MSIKLLVGCDPEMFLRNAKGKFVSAEGIVPGGKENPVKVKKGTIQADGFAAEIGIEPASSATEFADNVETVLEELRRYTGDLSIEFIDSVIFSEAVYKAQSDEGRALGCMPDFNAYTKLANPSPTPKPESFRTASGHIHIGWTGNGDVDDPGHFADAIAVTKQMDWALGVPTVAWNRDSRRRVLYGKAGAFRVKPYGCEYRTPDNTWLQRRDLMEFMFNNTKKGIDDLYSGNHYSARYSAQRMIDAPERYGRGDGFCQELGIPMIEYTTTATAKAKKAA